MSRDVMKTFDNKCNSSFMLWSTAVVSNIFSRWQIRQDNDNSSQQQHYPDTWHYINCLHIFRVYYISRLSPMIPVWSSSKASLEITEKNCIRWRCSYSRCNAFYFVQTKSEPRSCVIMSAQLQAPFMFLHVYVQSFMFQRYISRSFQWRYFCFKCLRGKARSQSLSVNFCLDSTQGKLIIMITETDKF